MLIFANSAVALGETSTCHLVILSALITEMYEKPRLAFYKRIHKYKNEN